MSELPLIKKIKTSVGDCQIDYNSLANLPTKYDAHLSDSTIHVTNEEKDIWNAKASPSDILSSETAVMYGLDETAVPDDVFAWIGKYNTHYWRRRYNNSKYIASVSSTLSYTQITFVNSDSMAYDIPYSDKISVNPQTGEISLVNQQTVSISYSQYTSANILKGKYFKPCNYGRYGDIIFCPSTAPNAERDMSEINYIVKIKTNKVSAAWSNIIGEWEFIYSSNKNEYPSGSNSEDGFEYQYLGIPFEKFPIIPQIATGIYTGTGTYGSSNPNTLTFEFAPKLVIINPNARYRNGEFNQTGAFVLPGEDFIDDVVSSQKTYISGTSGSKILTWYNSNNAEQQMNISGRNYYYTAIG